MIIGAIVGYLIGYTFIGGKIVGYFTNTKDLSKYGSKNIGATNMIRVSGNMLFGVLVFLIDFLKGVIATKIGYIFSSMPIIVPYFCILGHCALFYGNGGKGISTYYGMLCIYNPMILVATMFSWLLTFYIKRISFIASLVSVFISCLFDIKLIPFLIVAIIAHIDNFYEK